MEILYIVAAISCIINLILLLLLVYAFNEIKLTCIQFVQQCSPIFTLFKTYQSWNDVFTCIQICMYDSTALYTLVKDGNVTTLQNNDSSSTENTALLKSKSMDQLDDSTRLLAPIYCGYFNIASIIQHEKCITLLKQLFQRRIWVVALKNDQVDKTINQNAKLLVQLINKLIHCL